VITIKLPPLRERTEDIPPLIDFFLKKTSPDTRAVTIDREAMKSLLRYSYPGNVRELENIIERALILCEDNIIRPHDLPTEVVEPGAITKGRDKVMEEGLRTVLSRKSALTEKELLMQALQEAENNKTKAAEILKIGRTK
jgi:two-component system NtrC family response regulator